MDPKLRKIQKDQLTTEEPLPHAGYHCSRVSLSEDREGTGTQLFGSSPST